jgi:ABC-type nickel/cobalt efflux system permease component RcnA
MKTISFILILIVASLIFVESFTGRQKIVADSMNRNMHANRQLDAFEALAAGSPHPYPGKMANRWRKVVNGNDDIRRSGGDPDTPHQYHAARRVYHQNKMVKYSNEARPNYDLIDHHHKIAVGNDQLDLLNQQGIRY